MQTTTATPASEIDDIFAGSSSFKKAAVTGPPAQPSASSTTPSSITSKKKKKKTKSSLPSDASTTRENAKQPSHSSSSTSDPLKSNPSLPNGDSKGEKKRKIPETILDPSVSIASAKRRKANDSGGKLSLDGGSQSSGMVAANRKGAYDASTMRAGPEDDMDRFRDSRGTGPRRRTEEGYLIYKEDELGIKDEGGDTPLCPFDCNCCF